jgi:hypothetical protein
MPKSRFAAAASFATAAALVALLLPAAAPAKDLQSKLEANEATLSKVREKKGVLTSTISHDRDQIDHLTVEVADLRNQEAGVRTRLAERTRPCRRPARCRQQAPGRDAHPSEAGAGCPSRASGRDL